jgi:sulfate adenylyltransferase
MNDFTPAPSTTVGCLVDAARAAELKAASQDWPSWTLTARQLCDLELLANGAFAPLAGFMGEADHAAVVDHMRLADGTPWPVPVTLEVDPDLAADLDPGDRLALRDPEGTMVATLTLESRFRVQGETPTGGRESGAVCLGGPVEALQLPNQYDFPHLRHTPAESRGMARAERWARVLAVPTWQPLLGADIGELKRHVNTMGAHVLVMAEVGDTPSPIDRFALTRALQAALAEVGKASGTVTLVPVAVRDDPVRQAVLDAMLARAYGATHLWGPADPDAAAAVRDHAEALDLTVVDRPAPRPGITVTVDDVHRRLARGESVPDGVAPRPVLDELHRALPPRHERGLTVFFTGLSGSGKSTVANVVAHRLREDGHRTVTLLDGDLVRQHLSSELGFSREHRDVNVRRIGWVASEITRHGGIAVCCPIAPYDEIRQENRRMVEATGGGFVLVHVATPLEVCEARDRKGLYAKARAGEIEEFTGISDPYEEPADAEVVLDTTDIEPEAAAEQVLAHLRDAGWLPT